MDPRDSSAPPTHLPHHHHPQPPPPLHSGIFLSQTQQHLPNNAYHLPNNNSLNPTTSASVHTNIMQNPGFPFNSMVAAAAAAAPKPMDHLQSDVSHSGGGSGGGGFSIEPARKKRGRPRKYSPDNSIGLGLSPAPVSQISSLISQNDAAVGGGGTPSSENQGKKHRGRPPGSVKRQLDALGAPGVGFTPHVITVGAGEGRFEIISLSGSFLLSESNGNRSRTGGLSVSLAGSDGRVLGGGVAGMLKAASPVQVVVGSFIADGKKSKSGPSTPPPPHMLNFGGTGASPSPGASSDSGEENDDPSLNHGSGPYGNAPQPGQSMPMYSNIGWPNSMKIHPN